MRHPPHPLLVSFVAIALGVAAPHDAIVQFGLGDLPGVSGIEPVVGRFDLPAIVDLLIEDPELVADAVADCRSLQGRKRVEVAGGQPAQAAVSQARLLLAVEHLVVVLAHRGQRLAGSVLDPQAQQVIAQVRSEQEFRGQIAGHLRGLLQIGLGGLDPTILHAVTYGQRKGVVVVLRLQ